MGNKFCCSNITENGFEFKRSEKDKDDNNDTLEKAKGGQANSLNAAPYFEQKSLEVFENQELSVIKKDNFNSESYRRPSLSFQGLEFKPDESIIFNFLVNKDPNKNIEIHNFISDRVNQSRFSKNLTEKYKIDFTECLSLPEFTRDRENIIELPAVYLDKEKKDEIYMGTWIKINTDKDFKEIKDGPPATEEIKDLLSFMKFHGYGIYIRKDETVQEGVFRNGVFDGPGKLFMKNGDTFIGNFKGGLLNHNGVFIDFAGDIYEGEFKDNAFEGKGQENFVDGSTFTGMYRDNKKNGQGIFTCNDGSSYSGEMKDNLYDGYGVYEWTSGLNYKGQWVKGLMEGTGIITTKNGNFYEGDFKNNKKEGFGLFWWNDKKYYTGYWKSGLQHGEGIYLKEGKVIYGIWENGKFRKEVDKSLLNIPQRNFSKTITFDF